MTNERGKSDRSVVPEKSPNNAAEPAAEAVEGRERAKGNSPDSHDVRTQRRMHSSDGSSGYVRQQGRTGNSGSRRSCTTSTTSSACARRTSR